MRIALNDVAQGEGEVRATYDTTRVRRVVAGEVHANAVFPCRAHAQRAPVFDVDASVFGL